MLKINILLDNLGNNQEAYTAISYANTLNDMDGYNVNLFIQNQLFPVLRPNCGVFPIEKALYVDGMTISTSLSTAKYLKNSVAKSKIMYIWEPEWLFSKMEYLETHRILNTKALLVAQNEYHGQAIFNVANRKPDALIKNFDLIEIIKCNSH